MKNTVTIFLFFCLVLSFTACGPSGVEEAKIDEKYIPKFLEIKEGKEALKSLIFWTKEWSLQYAHPYLFAAAGKYIVRYDTDENTVDTIIDLGESTPGGAHWFSTSSQGRYLTSYVFYHNNAPFQNYFLLDCREKTARLLTERYDESKIDQIREEKIPEEVKNELSDDLLFSSGYPETGCTLEGANLTENGEIFYSFQKENGESKKISCLGHISVGNYIIVDENTLLAIIPTDEERSGEMGYYKFVKVDVGQDRIVQEYILN